MKHLNFLTVLVALLFVTLPSLSLGNKTNQNLYAINTDNVSITIDSKTSDEDFKNITKFLEENGIIAVFSNINRNDEGLITGIRIKLEDTITNNRTVSNSSSNSPISKIVFGRKNGGLYVKQTNRPDPHIGRHRPKHNAFPPFGFSSDSLMNHQLNMLKNMFEFDEEHNSFTHNGQTFNFDEMRKRMLDMFEFSEDENGYRSMMESFRDQFSSCDSDTNKYAYHFNDTLDRLKHIVIDGHTSNYETLKRLAHEEKLESVDRLKPQTAKSIYGEKGKNGAIIATTKN